MLLTIKQGPNESLRGYITRFNETLIKVVRPSDGAAIMALRAGLRPTQFLLKITEEPPTSLSKLLERAYKEMDLEDAMDQRIKEVAGWRTFRSFKPADRESQRSINNSRATLCLSNQREIFQDLKRRGILLQAPPMDARSSQYRNNGKYCEFHQDQGHTTDECRTLTREIEGN